MRSVLRPWEEGFRYQPDCSLLLATHTAVFQIMRYCHRRSVLVSLIMTDARVHALRSNVIND
jgi:hypothetical protein